jgi:hypothetical protein
MQELRRPDEADEGHPADTGGRDRLAYRARMMQRDSAPARSGWLWQGQVSQAFWRVATLFSFVVNLALVIVVVLLAQQTFTIKNAILTPLLGGLQQNFVLMDEARIQAQIPVRDSVPARFPLNISQDITVVTTAPILIPDTMVDIRSDVLSLRAPATITLPPNTPLPIHLEMVVEVDQQIPVVISVAADIPLAQTQLHQPFTNLAQLVDPYRRLLASWPNSWDDVLNP